MPTERCLSDMLFSMMSMFNCDNCWLTRFTVADTFWLSERLVGIDKMTLQFCNFSLMNCFSSNRSFTICWWEESTASFIPTCRIGCSGLLKVKDFIPVRWDPSFALPESCFVGIKFSHVTFSAHPSGMKKYFNACLQRKAKKTRTNLRGMKFDFPINIRVKSVLAGQVGNFIPTN